MSRQPLDLSRTWTDAEYLTLGETDVRTELVDGKIVVSYQAVALHLFRLDGRRYVEHASARYGRRLVSAEPFPINVDTTELLEP